MSVNKIELDCIIHVEQEKPKDRIMVHNIQEVDGKIYQYAHPHYGDLAREFRNSHNHRGRILRKEIGS